MKVFLFTLVEELDDKGPQDRRGGAAYSDEDDDQEGPDDEDESDEDGDDDSTDVLAKCQRHLLRHRKICSHQVEQRVSQSSIDQLWNLEHSWNRMLNHVAKRQMCTTPAGRTDRRRRANWIDLSMNQ